MSDLDKEINELEKKTTKLKKLKEMFPDLRQDVSRWKTVRYCSKSVNSKADKTEIRHSCGCCEDAVVQVWPYIQTEEGPVYSDPPCFTPGQRDAYSYTDRADEGWEKQFRKHDISDKAIEQVAAHFKLEDLRYNDYQDDSQNEEENKDD